MSHLNGIRLVTFDVLYTIIFPRTPIHIQYARHFEPHIGRLDPDKIKSSFPIALKQVQKERPAYEKGTNAWWIEVIRRTAVSAGADEAVLNGCLEPMALNLIRCFSGKEGYMDYDDAIPTLKYLAHEAKVRTAVVSNADSRIRSVLEELNFPTTLAPIILSEEEKIEKPSPEIFLRALERVNSTATAQINGFQPIRPTECLHVGDELVSDYQGALGAGMKALLLRRQKKDQEEGAGSGVQVVHNLQDVLDWLTNKRAS